MILSQAQARLCVQFFGRSSDVRPRVMSMLHPVDRMFSMSLRMSIYLLA